MEHDAVILSLQAQTLSVVLWVSVSLCDGTPSTNTQCADTTSCILANSTCAASYRQS